VRQNEQMCGELLVTFCTMFLNLLINLFFIVQIDVLVMHYKFDYKSQKLTLLLH